MGLNLPVPAVTIGLLICSNLFMTLAWYGHLRFKAAPLALVIAVSWLIALPEYALQVPANRTGHGYFTAAQLKTIQEVISLTVFAGFSWLYLGERLGWQHAVGFGLICMGAWFVFHDWS
ncbi:DMT family protein [Paracoccus sp. Z118]|uniref:DMT family protein n=1 Tax=Paracoccus sp. Z118 TaxID=2851017 RepID=UPI001C2C2770|nr:DMT family protein [Paracoccus sp. Z118]MBV0890588.1 DMT family protein [Paracoccus sp. Z118]